MVLVRHALPARLSSAPLNSTTLMRSVRHLDVMQDKEAGLEELLLSLCSTS